MIAARNGHLDVCRLLLDKGAQVEAKSGGGWTPLHWASRQGHVEIVRLLCDRGADIEACSKSGYRPLHWAALRGHFSVVKELIENRSVDINAKMTYYDRTALRWARREKKANIADYLVLHGGIE